MAVHKSSRKQGDENAQRFKLTATGKLKHGVAGKRHRLISHNGKYIRQNRGTKVLSKADTATVKAWAPYGLG
ncbi:MAG: 50S ribosomal protein L35 [Sphingomonas sp. 28-62-20]|uniref:large ribosomal subunit protein bL35 n=1 Tax=Sphingomonas sp. 28-62-20 TaxID=1970433 RepID=UPI000BC99476|nr:MAG: 50S ribosomal protein L35 [Sphingomonas sp. 28-62-20]